MIQCEVCKSWGGSHTRFCPRQTGAFPNACPQCGLTGRHTVDCPNRMHENAVPPALDQYQLIDMLAEVAAKAQRARSALQRLSMTTNAAQAAEHLEAAHVQVRDALPDLERIVRGVEAL